MDLSRYHRLPNHTAPSLTAAMTVAGLVITMLYFGRELFVPLALAVLLSFALTPLVVLLRGFRVPRAAAVLLVVGFAFSIIFSLGAIMGRQLGDLAEQLPHHEAALRQKIRLLRSESGAPGGVIERTTSALEGLSRELDQQPQPATPTDRDAASAQRPIPVEIKSPPTRALEYYQSLISPLLTPLARMGLVLILVVFILLQREDLRDRLIRLFGGEDFERTTSAMNDAARRLSRLFLTLTTMNITYGAVMAVALGLLGIPSPILWGILAGLMRFVPYIGSIIAVIFPVLLAAAIDPGWTLVAIVILLFIATEFTMGQVMEPWLLGSSTGLTPLAVITSASFWTWLWGPVGLLLAVPLTVCLIVLGRHVPQLNFIYVLLGDEPALTPAQRFYQRMLARDLDEITFDAERFVKNRSVLSYFDEVALPGLELAQADGRRGRLDTHRMHEMQKLVEELIDELRNVEAGTPHRREEEENQTTPDPPVLSSDELRRDWRGAAPVLSIGIRNPLDRAAAAIFAHLLVKHGVGAEAFGPEDVATARMGALDLSNARLAVLSNLDAAHSPARTHLLMRRLRRSNASLEFVIGAWGEREAHSPIETVAMDKGGEAELRATTLRRALEIVLASAREPAGAPGAEAPQVTEKVSERVMPEGIATPQERPA